MSTKIWPSVNDVNGGVSGDGKTISEVNLSAWLALAFTQPWVPNGLAGGTSANLTLTISSGTAVINGYRIVESAALSAVLAASTSLDVYYQYTVDGNGKVTGGGLISQAAGGGAPARSLLLGTATTSAGAITAWVDKRSLVGSSALTLVGAFVSLPAAGTSGRMFWTSDTFELYRDDGVAWRYIGGSNQGTLAALPAAGYRGRRYFATDTGDTYRDDGATWWRLPGMSTINQIVVAAAGSQ